jgi:HSP20 family protein
MKKAEDHIKNKLTGYPGVYKPPFFEWNKVMEELKEKREGCIHPLTNISECPEYVKIEITAPGHKREDFIVSINNYKLFILVLSKDESDTNEYQQHEFNYKCFSHSIDLPEYIDTDFLKADYKSGILTFYFPKVNTPTINSVEQVVIY